MSSGNTDRQLQFMEDLGSTILCCTPSYAAYLAESIHERGLQDKIHLKAGIFGAEAWSEQMRQDISSASGVSSSSAGKAASRPPRTGGESSSGARLSMVLQI